MLKRDFLLEACLEFWEEYHERIEEFGYSLSKDSFMLGGDEGRIMATIRPAYSDEDRDRIREILPREYLYNGKKIKVGMSPSMEYLFRTSPKIF